MRIPIPIAVLTFFLSACASTPEKGYNYTGQTPAVRPPTYAPAGAGAPTRGQPGAVDPDRATLPRSPNRRPVEPRRDGLPQMMAADGDDARAVRLMFSEDAPATPEGLSTSAHRKCWNDVREMMRKSPGVLKLTHAEAKCLRHRVWENCGQRFIEAAMRGDEDFLRRYPPNAMQVDRGRERTVGDYNLMDFEAANTGRRTLRHCGRNLEYSTRRVGDLFREMTAHGDDVMGWRNP